MALYSAPATHTTTTAPTHTAMPTPASTWATSGSVGGGERRHDDSTAIITSPVRAQVRELRLIGTLPEGPADWMRVTRCRSSRIIGAPDKRNIATGVQSSTNIYSITAGPCLGNPLGCAP